MQLSTRKLENRSKQMSRINALHVSPRRRMVHRIRRYGLPHRHDWSRFWATIWHRQRTSLIPCLRVTISLRWRRVRDQRLTLTHYDIWWPGAAALTRMNEPGAQDYPQR